MIDASYILFCDFVILPGVGTSPAPVYIKPLMEAPVMEEKT